MRAFWRRFARNRAAVFGLAVVISFLAVALAADGLAPYEPLAISHDSFAPPSPPHWMGTDDVGRDILSGVLFGARISLLIGFAAASASILLGTIIGAIAGYFGGVIDDMLMRVTEMFQVIPRLILAIVIVAIYGPSVLNVIVAIGFLSWPSTARIVRSQFLSLREREFVEASVAMGDSWRSIVFSEILPNVFPSIIVDMTLLVSTAILLEAGLSFVGLSDPRVVSWGRMLMNAQQFIFHGWWLAFFPGLAITLTTLALNLFGDGLNDALAPKLKQL